MRSKKILLLLSALAALSTANAETILLNEDFDNDYDKSFQYLFDGDAQAPDASIAPIFYSSSTGTTMAWWIARDSNTSTDKYIASHSYYETPGKSNDWLISIPLTIPTTGFILEFDAQCVNVRGTEYISDLSLFITEELIDVMNLPTTPTHVWQEVPYGKDLDNCEGDWTHYTYSLDEYAGKTIYINFVNLNEDKDILCLDNVRVVRHDAAILEIDEYDSLTVDASQKIGAAFEVVEDNGIDSWEMNLLVNGTKVETWQGGHIDKGQKQTTVYDLSLNPGESTNFEFVLSISSYPELKTGGSITRMAFVPEHRVFFEETTSLHCGNCPMGMYTIESLLSDPILGEKVIPVSVHIESMGYDPMATSAYFTNLPITNSAPLIFVERNTTYDGLIPAYDGNYDPTNENSFAYRIAQRAAQYAPLGVKVDAQWVIEGSDTTAVNCTATVTPAYNISGEEYRVAFILTENNVGIDNNPYWMQDNYLSGADYESHCGGWCDLDKYVINARYHDVGRAISKYEGHYNSLPTEMKAGEDYTYSYTIKIPDTALDSSGFHLSDAIRTEFCEISAIVINSETGLVANADRVAMSDRANDRFTAEDLVKVLGITDITTDHNDGIMYNLLGMPVDENYHGIVIKNGQKLLRR